MPCIWLVYSAYAAYVACIPLICRFLKHSSSSPSVYVNSKLARVLVQTQSPLTLTR